MDSQVKQGYKQTEVGVIPEDWQIFKIGDIALKVGSGITPTGGSIRYKKEGRPFIRSQNVGWGKILYEDLAFIDEETHQSFPSTELIEDDVLLNITGASIGRSTIIDKSLVGGNVNQHVCIIRSSKEIISSKFLNCFLLSKKGQKQIDSFQAGGNRQGLNFSQIKSIQITLPPIAEQEKIAEALSDVDSLIESLEELIAKKRHIKQGAMQELLTGKRRLISNGEWRVDKMGNIADIDPENIDSKTSLDYLFNYISLEDVDCGKLKDFSEQKFETAPSRARRRIKNGDILLATVRPNLKSHLFFDKKEKDWICSTGFSVLRCREEKAHPKYVYFHLFSDYINGQIETLISGSNYPAINSRDVKALEIPMPPTKAEQEAIAEVLTDMDNEITALEEKLQKTRHLKQGMMQELLTGKTRLI